MRIIIAIVLLVSSLANAQIKTSASKIVHLDLRNVNLPDEVTIKNNVNIPPGWERVVNSSYHNWLINQEVIDTEVKTYNGKTIYGLNWKYKIKFTYDIGKKDLHQCADAAIYLNARYKYDNELYDQIQYTFTNGQTYSYQQYLTGWKPKVRNDNTVKIIYTGLNSKPSVKNFKKYLEYIWMYAGTYSLVHFDTNPISLNDIDVGDMFIQATRPDADGMIGPGHAMTIIDMIQNIETGERKYMLAQSFMPAQEQHILINQRASGMFELWYSFNETQLIHTPFWVFHPRDLKRFRY